jgi:hypothetical protein
MSNNRTKTTHPKLSHRLPREKAYLVVPMGDGMTRLERALELLGSRVKQTKQGFMLDGKPCNTEKIFQTAGIPYEDK